MLDRNYGEVINKLTDQELIRHSIVYHHLINCGFKATAELMQAECYEVRFYHPINFLNKFQYIIYK
uniref:LisH domain-containing protein n=1 Tax=Heterorhabditis bacteriophora TaxID=37862 RepID=A0A1I7W9S9_HETBA